MSERPLRVVPVKLVHLALSDGCKSGFERHSPGGTIPQMDCPPQRRKKVETKTLGLLVFVDFEQVRHEPLRRATARLVADGLHLLGSHGWRVIAPLLVPTNVSQYVRNLLVGKISLPRDHRGGIERLILDLDRHL